MKLCLLCNNEFIDNSMGKSKKYCSRECLAKYNYLRNRKLKKGNIVYKLNCIECTREFKSNNKKRIYCSEYCKKTVKNKKSSIYYHNNKSKIMERTKKYARLNNDKRTMYLRKYRKKLKNEFLNMYGNSCICCGENKDDRFLTLDHVNNDAYKQKANGSNLLEYKKAVKEYRPDLYQVLCWNCNCGKNVNGGICPHKEILCQQKLQKI